MVTQDAPEYAAAAMTGCASKWLPGTRDRLYIIFARTEGHGDAMKIANEVKDFCDNHLDGATKIRTMELQDCLLNEDDPLLKKRINEKKAPL